MKKLFSAIALALLSHNVSAQVVADPGVIAGITAQLSQGASQIASLSKLVSAAHDQLSMLQKVSDGIRQAKDIIGGGAQGLLGEAAGKLGLKDVFTVGKQLQATVSDGMQLYRDARALPDEAKAQLRDLGLSIDELREYMSGGVLYDAFDGMDIADWQKVFKNPMDALAEGALGRACDRTSAYADTETLRKQYAEALAKMTPAQRAQLSGSMGLDMAFLNVASWSKEMEKRLAKTVEFSVLADKLNDAVTGKGEQLTIVQQVKAEGAATVAAVKVQIEQAKQRDKAAGVGTGLSLQQTMMEKERLQRGRTQDTQNAMLGGP